MAYHEERAVGAGFQAEHRDIFSALASGARNMVAVALATAAAGIIVGVVAMGLGQLITEIIDVLSGGNIFLHAGHHGLCQPDHRHGTAHHRHLYRHGLPDGTGHRRHRRR